MVLYEGVARDPLRPGAGSPTVAEVASRLAAKHGGVVQKTYENAFQGFSVRLSEAAARRLALEPAVRVVEQNVRGHVAADAKVCERPPNPANFVIGATTFPTTPQPVPCPSPSAGCANNWGLDRIDQEPPLDFGPLGQHQYTFDLRSPCPPGTGNPGVNCDAPVHVYLLDTGVVLGHVQIEDAAGASRFRPGVNVRVPITSPDHQNTADDYGHGSHVAGIVAGKTYGVAKGALVHPLKLSTGSSASFGVADMVEAIDWILANHPAGAPGVASLSANNESWQESEALRLALRRLLQGGIVFVQAAGNNLDDAGAHALVGHGLPEEIIVAGGVDWLDRRWQRDVADPQCLRKCQPFDPPTCTNPCREASDPPGPLPLCLSIDQRDCGSNYGPQVDLWAPSSFIVSMSHAPDQQYPQRPRGICYLSGTSMAAPHVAGVAALLLARYPNASPSAVEKALLRMATRDRLDPAGLQGAENVLLHTELPPDDPSPVAGDDRFSTPPGQPIIIRYDELLRGDFSWDRQSLHIDPDGFGPATGGILETSFSDRVRFIPTAEGVATFSYTVADAGGATDTAEVRILVEQSKRPPVAADDCFEVAAAPSYQDCTYLEGPSVLLLGTNLTALTANDTDPDGDLGGGSPEYSARPERGVLDDSILGEPRFCPAPGQVYTDTFRYVIRDTVLLSDEATVTVHVGGDGSCAPTGNQCPTPQDDSLATEMNTGVTFLASALLANDTDPDGDPVLFYRIASLPANGELTLEGYGPEDSVYRYTPHTGFVGFDSFEYQVRDGECMTSTATVNITVAPPSFIGNPDYFTTSVGTLLRVLSTQLTSNDTPGAIFIRAENPRHGTLYLAGLAPEGSLYDFIPDAGYLGATGYDYLITPNGNEPYTRVTVNVQVVDQPPSAQFDSACVGLACSFNAAPSTDDVGVASRSWSFGDGAAASGTTASHTYGGRNSFPATLTVADTSGQTTSVTRMVTADALPAASFTFSCSGLTCSFNGTASTDDAGVAGYVWGFGDGASATGATASHTYATSGERTATLTVTDTFGQSASTSRTVRIDLPPAASFTFSCAGLTCSFNASASSDDFGIASYAWSFGDGATGSGVTPSRTYATSGTRTVTLTVTDTAGQTGTTSRQVTADAPPVASFTWSCSGRTCSFNASGSTDNGTITAYAWTFGDGTTGSGVAPSRTYAASGTFTVGLTVTDNAGQAGSTTRSVLVKLPPAASFTSTCNGLSCSFNASGSTDDLGIASYAWNFGDGTTGAGVTASRNYAANGTYTVTLTVTDIHGLTATTTRTVTVSGPTVIGEAGLVDLGTAPFTVYLSRSYANPVVFAQPLSDDWQAPALTRIYDVQPNRFTVMIDSLGLPPNPTYAGGRAHWIVLEAGSWELEGLPGARLEVGKITTSATVGLRVTPNTWAHVNFAGAFSQVPVILTQIQTRNDAAWTKTRQRSPSTTGFDLAMEHYELESRAHSTETLGWLAVRPSVGRWSNRNFSADRLTGSFGVTDQWSSVGFGDYCSAWSYPYFLASISSTNELHGHLRWRGLVWTTCQTRAELMVQEEQTWDYETVHLREDVDRFAIDWGTSALRGARLTP